MVDMVTLIVGGTIGALLTLGTKWVEEWRDRRQRRRALATALLVELRSLEISLRGIVTDQNLPQRPFGVASHFFDRARTGGLSDLALFVGQSVYEVMKFGGYVKAAHEDFAKGRSEGWSDVHDRHVRFRAAIAACRAPLVKTALLKEGAAEPDDALPEQSRYPQLPPLPPPAFEPWRPNERAP